MNRASILPRLPTARMGDRDEMTVLSEEGTSPLILPT